MANKVSLKRNIAMNALLTMSSFIYQFVSYPYVSRVLGPDGMGKVTFAISLITYFTLLSQMGIPTYGIVACVKVRDNREELTRTVHELLFVNLIMALFSYALFFICLFTVPKLSSDKTLYAVASVSILMNAAGIEWLYKALEQYSYITVRSVAFKFLALALMLAFVKSPQDYIQYAGTIVFAVHVSQLLNLQHSRKFLSPGFMGSYHLKRHWRPIATFFLMSCATTIYTHLDTVMLGFFTSDEVVGYYNAAVKIKVFLLSIVVSGGAAILPRASYYIQNKEYERFLKINSVIIRFSFLFGMSVSVFFFIFAEPAILFLSGDAYLPSVRPMRIIMPTVLTIGLTNTFGFQTLIPMGKENIVLRSEIVGLVVNVIANSLFIPVWDASGAALGTLLAELSVLIVQAYYLRREILAAFSAFPVWRFALVLLVSSLLSVNVFQLDFSPFIILLFAAMLFFLPLLLFTCYTDPVQIKAFLFLKRR